MCRRGSVHNHNSKSKQHSHRDFGRNWMQVRRSPQIAKNAHISQAFAAGGNGCRARGTRLTETPNGPNQLQVSCLFTVYTYCGNKILGGKGHNAKVLLVTKLICNYSHNIRRIRQLSCILGTKDLLFCILHDLEKAMYCLWLQKTNEYLEIKLSREITG